MYFLLFGEDTIKSRKKLAAMRERFSAQRDAAGLNASVLKAKTDDADRVGEALFSSPFLADKKLVVLDGYLRAPDELQAAVAEMLARKPESTNAIFFEDCGAADLAKSPLLPLMKAQKFTEECVVQTPAQLQQTAAEECSAAGVALQPAAARALMAAVGDDAWRLHEETAKLIAYALATAPQSGAASGASGAKAASGAAKNASGAAITPAMVADLVPDSAREESLFALTDALMEGRARDVAVLLESMLDAGAAELQIVAMLEKHFRTLIAAADLLAAGISDKNELARRLGLHPFPAGKALAAVRRAAAASGAVAAGAVFRARHAELLEIERGIKTSAAKPNVLLATWLVRAA